MLTSGIDALLQPLGPFERPPVIAAAISGGSDSVALGLLLADWIAVRGGLLHVLSVDHGLRVEARAECDSVARRFATLPGCSAQVLEWRGAKPATGVQQAARAARYRLMTAWCRWHGVLHLALGHTADDQAETFAMRRAEGSSPFGLAAMPAVSQRDGVRLLRPLLGVTRAALRDWLAARGESWIEDPSNSAAQFERTRWRETLAASGEGPALAAQAAQFGQARDEQDRAVAQVFAAAGRLHDEGYLTLALDAWVQAGPDMRVAILRRVLLAIGGHDYPPAPDQLERLAVADPAAMKATLAGCVLAVRQGRLTVCREAGDIREDCPVQPGWAGTWDHRFALTVSTGLAPAGGLVVSALGEEGQRQAVDRFGVRLKRHPVPEPGRAALPALWRDGNLLSQPHLGVGEGLAVRLSPRHSVTTCGFTVALRRPHTMYSSFPG
ncbi:MAG TPA: tRNA lysidine(34) synthetase TilS [Dongiaceae bacterium]|nr:tRNA lysidine(34) synthetase TilS [Dongiaceae bacterium]